MKITLLAAFICATCGILYVAAWFTDGDTNNLVIGLVWFASAGLQCGTAFYQRKTEKLREETAAIYEDLAAIYKARR